MSEKAKMDIKHLEASLETIMEFWVKAYKLPEGHRIHRYEWFMNTKTDRVMFKVFTTDRPDPFA